MMASGHHRNATITPWSLLHVARLMSAAGGLPNEGNDQFHLDCHINRRQTLKSNRDVALRVWRGLLAGQGRGRPELLETGSH